MASANVSTDHNAAPRTFHLPDRPLPSELSSVRDVRMVPSPVLIAARVRHPHWLDDSYTLLSRLRQAKRGHFVGDTSLRGEFFAQDCRRHRGAPWLAASCRPISGTSLARSRRPSARGSIGTGTTGVLAPH